MFDGKLLKGKLVGSEDERAVSPVIGVILMVAITVILAAVIAAFVLDLGPGEASPSAQIQYEANSSFDNDEPNDILLGTFSHGGGDSVAHEDIVVIIDEDDEGEARLNAGNEFRDGVADGEFQIEDFNEEGEFSAGDSSDITGATSQSPFEADDDSEYEVTFVHEPSGSVLIEATGEFVHGD